NPDALGPDRIMPRLPGHALPPDISVTGSLAVPADLVLLVVPMQHLRAILSRRLGDAPGYAAPLVACCKGVERGTFRLPGEILAELAPGRPHASLSGPNFAGEIAAGLPAASVLACRRLDTARELAASLSAGAFRVYAGADPLGVEIGAAAKNVIAIAAGAAIGAGFGENARAALVTRGIAELSRLIVALGGQAETASGLSGVGDLVLTCTGPSSRNFSLGVALGQGQPLAAILGARSTVAEGVETAPALSARARAAGVSAPIIDTVAALLTGRIGLDDARHALLNRPLATE
ncbi:NAD(P)H-dependent glycerol-3-phosphate dehydrogenase, partial [Acetobacteraceae bacterium KSS8]|nr:NAD(P)H-dependent glycerol-3-phosphate dehydrogenase [Acetobacteraceae bacterium KSS8]